MTRAYLLGLILSSFSATALSKNVGDEKRYVISCVGNLTIDDESQSEAFTWIVDEGAPNKEQIIHLGKSVCDGKLSCSVEIKPYQINVRTTGEETVSGRHRTFQFDGTINRVSGSATVEGIMTESHDEAIKRQTLTGSYLCKKHPFKRVI